MGVNTSAGTIMSVSAVLPATYDQAGFEALTWAAVGELTDIPEFGRAYTLVTHNPVATRNTQKFKGSYNEGSVSCQLGRDIADAGQAILDTALNVDDDIAFKVALSGGGETQYFQAKVMSFTTNVGSVDSITGSTVQIEISEPILII